MKTGLAIWHYPHRTGPENIRFFATQGYDAVSQVGSLFVNDLNRGLGPDYAAAIRQTGLSFTVHYTLPSALDEASLAAFCDSIDTIAAWQGEYGLISVLSFDVPQFIRPNVTECVAYVLRQLPTTRVALEDFCLHEAECLAVEPFRDNPNFGILLDIGHLNIRIRGKKPDGRAVFSNSALECPQAEKVTDAQLLTAFGSKRFPIFEIHHHSNDGVRDLHLFLQDGIVDTPALARVLKQLNYAGIVTIESAPGYMFPCAGQAADDGIARSLALWQKALAEA